MSESGYGNKAIEYSLYNLENDLKKIIAHSGNSSEITAADVSDIIAANPENNVFAMLDAIGRNRKDEAFRLLHNLPVSYTHLDVYKRQCSFCVIFSSGAYNIVRFFFK